MDQPVEAFQLVLAHGALDAARLDLQARGQAGFLALVRQQRVVLLRLARAAVVAVALFLLGGRARAGGDKVLLEVERERDGRE